MTLDIHLRQAMSGTNGVDGVHIRLLTDQAHQDDGFGMRCDGSFKQLGAKVIGARIDVYKHRLGTGQVYGLGTGDEVKAEGDDFVT